MVCPNQLIVDALIRKKQRPHQKVSQLIIFDLHISFATAPSSIWPSTPPSNKRPSQLLIILFSSPSTEVLQPPYRGSSESLSRWALNSLLLPLIELSHCFFGYSWIADQVSAHEKSIFWQTRRVTTIPRPPLESSWRGEFRSFWAIFV